MARSTRHTVRALSGLAALSLALVACSNGSEGASETKEPAPTEAATEEASETPAAEACSYPMTVTDMAGNEVTIDSVDSVVVTDNRMFAVLNEWGIHPTAAPRALMSEANSWKNDESILDTGSHGEPNFEQVVAADPTIIINGYRYGDHAADMQAAAPDAAFIDTTNNDLSADEYATQSVTMLGDIFCKQAEAEALVADFHTAVADAKAAYNPDVTVMGLVTSGNEIRYSNPADGRGASIFFSLLNLTPALDAEGSANHQGDDISLEAIAEANADFFLVLDRDAAFSSEKEVTPAIDLINGSATLAESPAVLDQAIYVMPSDYYLTEDIYAYITILEGLTEAFSVNK